MVVHLEWRGNALLARAPVAVAETFGHVAHPRRGDPPDAACADELIEQSIGDRSDERQIAAPLPDQLVAGRERDQGLQRRTHGHRGAVGDESLDGLRHRHHLAAHHGQGNGPARMRVVQA